MAGAASHAPRIALVLPGGGARGAYEAGALSVLLPAIEARGERPSIVCGTSVGAINAAAVGSLAHRPAHEIGDALLEQWRALRKGDVMRRIVGPGLALTALRAVGEALEIPGVRLAGLLDPSPLRRSLERWVDWDMLHANIERGEVEAVCVVATSLARGGPTAFVHTHGRAPVSRPNDALQLMPVPLRAEHVRASAAIPMLFPPVEVTAPPQASGHYLDGGTRLNSPLAPALALGATHVAVVGFQPFRAGPAGAAESAQAGELPRMADVAANVIDGLLVDQVVDDLHRLAAINSFLVDGSASGPTTGAVGYRASRGRTAYRRVSYALVAPEGRGELAAIADDVFDRRYAGLKGLLRPDYPLISRVLGGRSPARGELLSFLLFDREHVEALIGLGRQDARRWLDRHPHLWCSDASHDFDVDASVVRTLEERERLTEWRDLRRRP